MINSQLRTDLEMDAMMLETPFGSDIDFLFDTLNPGLLQSSVAGVPLSGPYHLNPDTAAPLSMSFGSNTMDFSGSLSSTLGSQMQHQLLFNEVVPSLSTNSFGFGGDQKPAIEDEILNMLNDSYSIANNRPAPASAYLRLTPPQQQQPLPHYSQSLPVATTPSFLPNTQPRLKFSPGSLLMPKADPSLVSSPVVSPMSEIGSTPQRALQNNNTPAASYTSSPESFMRTPSPQPPVTSPTQQSHPARHQQPYFAPSAPQSLSYPINTPLPHQQLHSLQIYPTQDFNLPNSYPVNSCPPARAQFHQHHQHQHVSAHRHQPFSVHRRDSTNSSQLSLPSRLPSNFSAPTNTTSPTLANVKKPKPTPKYVSDADRKREYVKREQLRPEEMEFLVQQFSMDRKPSVDEIKYYAMVIGKDEKKVQKWFQNKRRREMMKLANGGKDSNEAEGEGEVTTCSL